MKLSIGAVEDAREEERLQETTRRKGEGGRHRELVVRLRGSSVPRRASTSSQLVLTMMVKVIRCIRKKLRWRSILWKNVGEGEEESKGASGEGELLSVGEGSSQSRRWLNMSSR